MRPDPVVFRLLAFSDQLSAVLLVLHSKRNSSLSEAMSRDRLYAHPLIFAAGYPHDEQVCFWTWRDRRPVFIELVPVLLNPFLDLNPAQSAALYPLSQDPESTDRSVCTERATCCGVFRKIRFPSL